MKKRPVKNEAQIFGRRRCRSGDGTLAFSFVELLVAISIAAIVMTVSVLAYQTISQSANRLGSYGAVQLASGTMENFYGISENYVRTYFAPSYTRAVEAETLRGDFYEDLEHASAVFCLSRNGRSTIRPVTIPLGTGVDRRALDTPEAFRQFLATALPDSAAVFDAYRGDAPNANISIFILMPSDNSTELSVRALYEMDFVTSTNPVGTYASVRRYQGPTCTSFYDVFYPAPELTALSRPFLPVLVSFEREARLNVTEGSDVDRFKVAANRPFYFVWWPDPTSPSLEALAKSFTVTGTARDAYAGMGERTAFFLAFPMFPSL